MNNPVLEYNYLISIKPLSYVDLRIGNSNSSPVGNVNLTDY